MKQLISVLSLLILILLPNVSAAGEVGAKTSPVPGATQAVEQRVSINSDDIAELTKLKGVGVKKAEAIIAWRKENGDFTSIDQLLEVKGIGEATLAQNRDNLRL